MDKTIRLALFCFYGLKYIWRTKAIIIEVPPRDILVDAFDFLFGIRYNPMRDPIEAEIESQKQEQEKLLPEK